MLWAGRDADPEQMVWLAFSSLYRVAGGKQGATLLPGAARCPGKGRTPPGWSHPIPTAVSAAQRAVCGCSMRSRCWSHGHASQGLPCTGKSAPRPSTEKYSQADSHHHLQGLTNGTATGLIPTGPQYLPRTPRAPLGNTLSLHTVLGVSEGLLGHAEKRRWRVSSSGGSCGVGTPSLPSSGSTVP